MIMARAPKGKKCSMKKKAIVHHGKQNKEVVGLQRILEISPKGTIGILPQRHLMRDIRSLLHLLVVVYQVPNLLNERILTDFRHQGSAILAMMNQEGFTIGGRIDLCLGLTYIINLFVSSCLFLLWFSWGFILAGVEDMLETHAIFLDIKKERFHALALSFKGFSCSCSPSC